MTAGFYPAQEQAMPHCIIEYSRSLESAIYTEKLIQAIQEAAISSDLFEASHIRARAMPYDHFISGYQVENFIHITLKILSGRSQQQKKRLSEMVLKALEGMGLHSISLTVEVVEMDKATYSKKILHGL